MSEELVPISSGIDGIQALVFKMRAVTSKIKKSNVITDFLEAKEQSRVSSPDIHS